MNISGKAKVFGLIGHPVEHSLSPVLHHTLSDILGHEVLYAPFDVKKDLKSAIKGAYELNVYGLNVTVPYKQEVMEFLTEVDTLAKKIGAVNTLVKTENGYKGYNTDMPGLKRAMEHDGIIISGRDFYLIGAGGVARAALVMLLENKAKRVHILNRSIEKAKELAETLKVGYDTEVTYGFLDSYKEVSLEKAVAIQATNVGMYPNVEDVVITEKAFYEKVDVGYDLIFNPGETRFMQLTRQAGGKAYNGAKMLVYQGIIAFELWNQLCVSEECAEMLCKLVTEALNI
jgi:shikimate dehydrogenase